MKRPVVRKVIYKKMRYSWGLAEDGVVYIDLRAQGLKKLELLLHEQLHILSPHMCEEEVTYIGARLAVGLWKQGYRYTDNDTSQALQDGTRIRKK